MELPDFTTQKRDDYVIRANIDSLFSQLLAIAPDIPVAQLYTSVFRTKGATSVTGNPIYPSSWSDKKTLTELEYVVAKFKKSYKGNGVWAENDEDES